MLSETQIAENWKRFREIVNTEFEGERKENLNKMYDYFEDRMVLTPASGKEHFHNAFPGGYIDHVLRVIDYAKEGYESWKARGARLEFSYEELIFGAMHHDLGKVGDLDEDYYELNTTDDWQRKNRGKIYNFNKKCRHMTTYDRTVFILSQFHLPFTATEQIGIKCTDGMYDEANESILRQHEAEKQLKDWLPIILHHADMAATCIERDRWLNTKEPSQPANSTHEPIVMMKNKNIGKLSKLTGTTDSAQKIFDDLFN